MGQGSGRFFSISSAEKRLVLDSWLTLRPQTRDFGTSLFLNMINEHPHFANYWPFVSIEDTSFDRFTTQFMREFDELVLHINQPDHNLRILKKNAAFHMHKHIPKADYDRLRHVFLSVLDDHLGQRGDKPEVLDAWMKVMTICFSFITEMVDDLLDAYNAKMRQLQEEKEAEEAANASTSTHDDSKPTSLNT